MDQAPGLSGQEFFMVDDINTLYGTGHAGRNLATLFAAAGVEWNLPAACEDGGMAFVA